MRSLICSLFILATFLTTSCTPDTPVTPASNSVTIKYEMSCSAPILPAPSGLYNYVTYTKSDGNGTEERNVITSSPWSKTITLNVTQRPLGIVFSGQTFTGSNGTITSKIYVNNELKATRNSQISNSGSVYAGSWVTTYTMY